MRSYVGRRRVLALALVVAALLPSVAASGSTEIVKNGLLTQGRDGKPDHWRHDGYAADATEFSWSVGEDGLGALTIVSSKPNDARWVQNVPVSPRTWYRVSAWVRAENVGAQAMGAYISVMDTFSNSRDLRGTSDWQPVGFWVKTGALETSLPITCRLGGYSSLNTGTANCTGISVVAAGIPRVGDPFTYGGTPDNDGSSSGLPIAQGVAVLVVIGVLLLLWRYLAPPSARIPR